MKMKSKLVLLTAFVAAGTSIAVVAATAPSILAARRKRKACECDDYECGDGCDCDYCDYGKAYYTVPSDFPNPGDVASAEVVKEHAPEGFEMGSGAIRTPDSVTLEAAGANRSVVLKPNGSLEYYEDGELVGRDKVEAWPEGNFKVHIVFLYETYWLFFEKAETGSFDGISMEPGYYKMDYAMALDTAFKALPLSRPKTIRKEGLTEPFVIRSQIDPLCIGKDVMLQVPDHVRTGDIDRTIERFDYFGSEDGGIYRCEVKDERIYPYLYVKDGYDVALVDNLAVVDLKDCYMIYRWMGTGNYSEAYAKDCFGKHDFARFKQACAEGELRRPFYDRIEDPKKDVIVK